MYIIEWHDRFDHYDVVDTENGLSHEFNTWEEVIAWLSLYEAGRLRRPSELLP